MKKNRNPVCLVYWRDASYTFNKKIPENIPTENITCGFIISSSEEFINVSSNVSYDSKMDKIVPNDGFIIPKSAVTLFKKVGYLKS